MARNKERGRHETALSAFFDSLGRDKTRPSLRDFYAQPPHFDAIKATPEWRQP
jgi:hypothetical protein